MPTTDHEDDPTYGVAMTAIGLWVVTVVKLQSKGVLSNDEIVEAIDIASLKLEEVGIASRSPAGQAAHTMLAAVLETIRGGPD